MVDRKVDWEYLALAFFVTVIVVSAVFFLGGRLNDYKVERLREDISELETDQRAQSLGFEIMETSRSDQCQAIEEWRKSTLSDLRNLREKVEAYEDSTKLRNRDHGDLKKRYTNLVIQNMLEMRRMEERCGQNVTEVIYLYSNNCPGCEDQGTILSHYRGEYPDRLAVHPLDADLGMKHVDFIENLHDIERYPAMIVEGEAYQGFKDKEEFGQILKERGEGITG